MKIKNLFRRKRKNLNKEILMNQKLNNIQTDLTLIKMQINWIVKFLGEKKNE